jgi:CPA2 family monovalent cation:H+ antiporter-2
MHAADLLLEIGAIVLVLAALARIAARLQFSPIPFYLLVGLGFGEGSALLPLAASETFISGGAQIGLILLLFMMGLEYSAAELTQTMRDTAPATALDLVLNFTPGLLGGLLLGWSPTASLFLGGVTYISSSGVISKLLQDLNRMANRESPTILSLLVAEDLVMALYLPLMGALLIGGSVLAAFGSAVLAVGAVAMILVFALRFEDRISRAIFSRSDEALLLSILGLTAAVAGLSEKLHISAAVGAFLVGIIVSGPAADSARALLTPLRHFFAAIFFAFFGLSIDPASLPPVAVPAVILGVVTAATKIATGWWSAGRAGAGPKGRARAGATLVARGEFSIVIAGLGASAGVEAQLAPLSAAYVLLTAIAGPLLARGADGWVRLRTR